MSERTFLDELLDELPATTERELYRQHVNATADAGARRFIASMIDDGLLPAEALPFHERIRPIEMPVPGYDPRSYEFAGYVGETMARFWYSIVNAASTDDNAGERA